MLRISQKCYDEVIDHCQREYPKEACGILGGEEGRVRRVYTMTNVEQSPIGYSMDPREQLRIEKEMRRSGQRMVGIYHSHTATDAYPSPVDERLSLGPDLSYVLVSLKEPTPVVKSYRIDLSRPVGERIREEPIAPEGNSAALLTQNKVLPKD